MALNLNIVRTQKSKEEEGVWVDYPLDETIKFKIARDGNKQSMQLAADLSRKKYRNADRNMAQQTALINEVVVQTILLDWKGLTDGDEEFVYNHANALALMKDEQYHDLRDWIIMESKNMRHFIEEELKEDIEQAKKS